MRVLQGGMWWWGLGFPRGRVSITKDGFRMARKMGQGADGGGQGTLVDLGWTRRRAALVF